MTWTTRTLVAAFAFVITAGPVARAQCAATDRRPTAQTAAALYKQSCADCHDAKGEGKPNVRPLNGDLSYGSRVEDISTVIRDGIKGSAMMPFKGKFTEAQIRALAQHVRDLSMKK